MTPKPNNELEPHYYVPSAAHMGDCQVCGHLQGAPIHSPVRIKEHERKKTTGDCVGVISDSGRN